MIPSDARARCFGPSRTSPPRGERERGTCVQLPVTLVRFAYKRIYYLARDGGGGVAAAAGTSKATAGRGMHDTDSLPRLARSGTRCRRSTSLVEPTANEQIHVSTHFRHQEDCISFASKMRGQVRHVHLGRHQGHFICPRENKVALKSARPFSIALLLLPCFRHTASVYCRIAD